MTGYKKRSSGDSMCPCVPKSSSRCSQLELILCTPLHMPNLLSLLITWERINKILVTVDIESFPQLFSVTDRHSNT